MHIKNIIPLSAIVVFFFLLNGSYANDGRKLFKQNCSACHKIEGNLVGPGLKGIRDKWSAAGEEKELLSWVKDPAQLFQSGNSEMAKKAWEAFPSEMTAQSHLTDEQIAQIFDYVDSDIKEETKENKETPLKKGRIYTPEEVQGINKKQAQKNRIVFFLLITVGIIILISIFSISKNIEAIYSENFEKNKSKNSKSLLSILLLLPFLPLDVLALSFEPGNAKESWFLVSTTDNLVFLLVDLILLWVLFKQYRVYRSIMQKYGYISAKRVTRKTRPSKELVRFVTNAVPVEEQNNILLDHDYDGIRELDNNLPPWWLWSFILSIIFAFVYLFHFHVIKTGDLQASEYEKTIHQAELEVNEYLSKMAMNVDENNVEQLLDNTSISNGKELFKTNCTVCHKETGEGLVGPNLTDDYWLIGKGDIKSIFEVVKYGTSNGMPEHESKLNPIELQEVSSYVLTLEYKEGKAPEGELVSSKDE